jgi:hypothetical protein
MLDQDKIYRWLAKNKGVGRTTKCISDATELSVYKVRKLIKDDVRIVKRKSGRNVFYVARLGADDMETELIACGLHL